MARQLFARNATEADIPNLAELWWQGWWDAHGDLLPAELSRVRTLDSFTARLRSAGAAVRVIGASGAPLGFYLIKGEELFQFYVSAAARGTGLATDLLSDAEDQFVAARNATAWLACAIGNRRAARFYEKNGWLLTRTETIAVEADRERLPLTVWRYEKRLPPRRTEVKGPGKITEGPTSS